MNPNPSVASSLPSVPPSCPLVGEWARKDSSYVSLSGRLYLIITQSLVVDVVHVRMTTLRYRPLLYLIITQNGSFHGHMAALMDVVPFKYM